MVTEILLVIVIVTTIIIMPAAAAMNITMEITTIRAIMGDVMAPGEPTTTIVTKTPVKFME